MNYLNSKENKVTEEQAERLIWGVKFIGYMLALIAGMYLGSRL